eukprot:Nitzschia sp. Nitz4//scaffold30_size153850//4468//6162//NITZ4_002755-RA/size153850-processed-gene-0.0-mRNA-1//1//CDS//3329547193//7559//frame0
MIKFPGRKKKTKANTSSKPMGGFRNANAYNDFSDEEKKEDTPDSTTALKLSSMFAASSDFSNINNLSNNPSCNIPAPVQLDMAFAEEGQALPVTSSLPLQSHLPSLAGDECLFFEDNPSVSHGEQENDVADPDIHAALQLPVVGNISATIPALPTTIRPTSPAHSAGPRPTRTQGLPTEINIDFDAVPPSPIRDPSVAFAYPNYSECPPDDLLHYRAPSSSRLQDFSDDLPASNSRTLYMQLWDAERLVRVILGKDVSDKPLESGSILQAIRRYAMMQQELISLRKQAEAVDNDPPAILTNLTSPATTKNSSSLSTPAKDSPPPVPEPVQVEPTADDAQQQLILRTTRKALVLAAQKCQSLESELKAANETIAGLRLDQSTSNSENQAVALDDQVENILDNLDASSSKLPSDRDQLKQLLSKYLEDSVKDQQIQSKRRELQARQQLVAAQHQICKLQSKIDANTTSPRSQDAKNEDAGPAFNIPDPLSIAKRQIVVKNERIAQLEASQLRLQNLLQMSLPEKQPFRESTSAHFNGESSERLRRLHQEHSALANSVQVLENELQV